MQNICLGGNMAKSKVYFTDFSTKGKESLLKKLERLIKKAGIEKIDFKDQYVVIKVHFGEPGNMSYLRPNYGKVIADLVKSKGGKVFFSDCNTLYVGRRKDALEHLDTAYENGYNPFATGCQVIIGDGVKGIDEEIVPINGEYIKEAHIGKAIMDADIFISLSHFKGHIETGFGGALKNIGMGCGSRAGKMAMHQDGKPRIRGKCVGCHKCLAACASGAIEFDEQGKIKINKNCVGCGKCIGYCNYDVIATNWNAPELLNYKIAEYAYAVVKDRPNFHVSLICDVSPDCDCMDENDIPIIPDIGMLASFDPVALDQACGDLANKAEVIATSELGKIKNRGKDHFTSLHPDTDWHTQISHGEKIGLGHKDYELIEVK